VEGALVQAALVGSALVIALAAALRSTWSPCGVSMLSTITPIAERARGHRYPVAVGWFILGATLGGASLGLGMAALAAAVASFGPSVTVALGVSAGLALLAAAADARLGGFHLPGHTRQVNELWFGRYRTWVYAGGFGWQIGVGLATFITTNAVYVMIAMAALTGEPLVALAIGTAFGFVRGLAVLTGHRLVSPDALLAFHRRFDGLDQPTRWACVAVLVAVGAFTAAVGIAPLAGVAVIVAAAALAVIGTRRPITADTRPLPAPRQTVDHRQPA